MKVNVVGKKAHALPNLECFKSIIDKFDELFMTTFKKYVWFTGQFRLYVSLQYSQFDNEIRSIQKNLENQALKSDLKLTTINVSWSFVNLCCFMFYLVQGDKATNGRKKFSLILPGSLLLVFFFSY